MKLVNRRDVQSAIVRGVLKYKPILSLGRYFPGVTIISRRADVAEIFERNREFSVAPYGVKLRACGTPGVLGMEDGPAYQRELRILKSAILPSDMPRLRRFGEEVAGGLVERALVHKTTLDFVSELVDPFALQYLAQYIGIPDPGHGALLKWFRMMNYYCFNVYLMTGPRIEIPTIRGTTQLVEHVERVVEARASRPGDAGPDDVLGRLLAAREREPDMTLGDVARFTIALASGSIAATFWQVITLFDCLLDQAPETLANLAAAARGNEDDVVREYVMEAARLDPIPAATFRYCEQDAVIARGTPHERTIPAGTVIALFLLAANIDPEGVTDPQEFRVGRPDQERIHFGHALHYCFGDRIAIELMTQIVKSVFKQQTVRRAPGLDGTKQYGPKGSYPDGVYPTRLVVQLSHI